MDTKVNGVLITMLLVFSFSTASAADKTKELSGISIMGNKEAPKSLFIVPWKSSELGDENTLSSSLLNEKMIPVDKDVFQRELDFYSATLAK
ncbi:MAG: hypothetical protein P8Y24_08545 [Gammaproteobacteria bacterium]